MKLIDLYNPNRFTIPATIRNGEGFTQVGIDYKQHLRITPDQVTPSIKALTNPAKRMLEKTIVEV